MEEKHAQQFRFRVVISVLFTVLVVIFGLFFCQFIFWRTSNMLLEESRQYFSQIQDELSLDFAGTRKTVGQTVTILSKTTIVSATSLEERLESLSLTAKMIVIADIFEALTASDRPYKKVKKLSEAVEIMGYMEKDHHIDTDLFHLFLSSGAYLEYARQYLLPDQVDNVDIGKYLNS
jgi:hypothetical protein